MRVIRSIIEDFEEPEHVEFSAIPDTIRVS